MSHVKIGHAVADENGTNGRNGSKAGNQNGRELQFSEWYLREWTVLLRHPDPVIREKIAKNIEAAVKNTNIGYSQEGNTSSLSSGRNSLHRRLLSNDYDFSEVGPCECDCSSLVTAAAIGAGVKGLEYAAGGNAPATANMKTSFVRAGFNALTGDKYLYTDAYLIRGDLLVREGHHVLCVLSDGLAAENYYPKYVGRSSSIVDALKAVGESDASLTHRKKIAKANDITLYVGTAKQNLKMLELLKNGKLKKA